MLPVKNSCCKEPELEVADYQSLGKHSCGRVCCGTSPHFWRVWRHRFAFSVRPARRGWVCSVTGYFCHRCLQQNKDVKAHKHAPVDQSWCRNYWDTSIHVQGLLQGKYNGKLCCISIHFLYIFIEYFYRWELFKQRLLWGNLFSFWWVKKAPNCTPNESFVDCFSGMHRVRTLQSAWGWQSLEWSDWVPKVQQLSLFPCDACWSRDIRTTSSVGFLA